MFVRLTASNEMAAGTRAAGASLTKFAGQAAGVGTQLAGPTSANVNKLGHAFLALLPEITGLNFHILRLGSVLGHLAVGGGVIAGVTIGIAAIGFAYRKLTEDARAAREENEKLIGSLVKAAETRIAGNLTVMKSELANREEQLRLALLMRDVNDKANASAADATIRTRHATEGLQKAVADATTAVNMQRRAVREAQAADDARLFQGPMQDMTPTIPKPDTSVVEVWADYATSMRVATDMYRLFGDVMEANRSRLTATEGLLQNLLRKGVDPMTAGVQKLVEEIRTLGVLLTELPKRIPTLPSLVNGPVRAPALPPPVSHGVASVSSSIIREAFGLSEAFSKLGGVLQASLGPSQIGGLVQAVASFGAFAVLLPVIEGFLEAIGPALNALLEPLREVGRILAAVLVPVFAALEPPLTAVARLFEALQPALDLSAQLFLALHPEIKAITSILRVVGTGFSYVVQAMGWFVEGLGKFIDTIVPDWISKVGKGLAAQGQAMQDSAVAWRRGTEDVAELGDAAAATAAALHNVPEGFKVALARFNATTGQPRRGDVAGATPGAAAVVINGPLTVVTPDPADFVQKLQQQARRGGALALRPAF